MRIPSLRLRPISKSLKISLVFLLPVFAIAQIPASAPIETPSTFRVDRQDMISNVSIELPTSRRIQASRVDLESTHVDLETVTVRPNDQVVSLLAANGVRQDSSALALIYDLNPQLDDLSKIQVGEQINLPTVEGPWLLEKALNRGYRIVLVRNFLAMQTLADRNTEMRDLRATLTTLEDQRFGSAEDKATLLESLNDTSKALDILDDPKMIVSWKVAHQAATEGQLIRDQIKAALASGRPISGASLDAIRGNLENLVALGAEIKSGGSGLVRTTIRTNSAVDGEPVKQLTVWYAPQGDRNQKRPCSMVSSPSVEAIARGDYLFWATRGGDVVTDEKPRKIRAATKDDPLDLPVVR